MCVWVESAVKAAKTKAMQVAQAEQALAIVIAETLIVRWYPVRIELEDGWRM